MENPVGPAQILELPLQSRAARDTTMRCKWAKPSILDVELATLCRSLGLPDDLGEGKGKPGELRGGISSGLPSIGGTGI